MNTLVPRIISAMRSSQKVWTTVGDIVRETQLDPGVVAEALDGLEREGLLEKSITQPDDAPAAWRVKRSDGLRAAAAVRERLI